MPRYALTIEYDGTPYAGWQRQANAPSVQGQIEAAISHLSPTPVAIRGAGRTDAGVHATGQVAHVDLARDWADFALCQAINAHLKDSPIAIIAVRQVSDSFDARFSAIKRHYRYTIINRRAKLTLDAHRAWQVKWPLDAQAMNHAAQILVGLHDFSTFRDSQCQARSPIRLLERICVTRKEDVIDVHVCAPSFLHRQVRSIVGSLEHIGSGKWQTSDLLAALEAKNRARCGQVAPPHGLYLVQVDYVA
jgi:tRNA pseudouridine38-40 synthase